MLIQAKTGLGVNSTLLILSIVIGILFIVASAFSCCACCCGSPVQVGGSDNLIRHGTTEQK